MYTFTGNETLSESVAPLNTNFAETTLKNSETEQLTNQLWTDDKPIYRKVITFGNIPDASTAGTVAHGISDLDTLINYRAFMRLISGVGLVDITGTYIDGTVNLLTSVTDTNCIINNAGTAVTTYGSAFFIVEYTKTA